MNPQEAQAQAQANGEQATAAAAPKHFLHVNGVTQITVSPIETLGDLLQTSGKVLDLTDGDSIDAALALADGAGMTAGAVRSENPDLLLHGLSEVVASAFQIAASEGLPVEVLMEGVRQHLQSAAQKAAKKGITEFFQDRGLTNLR